MRRSGARIARRRKSSPRAVYSCGVGTGISECYAMNSANERSVMTTSSEQQQKDLIRDRFTRTAEVFGDYAVSYRVRFAESLMRLVRAGKSDLVIDLACGPGTLALRFAPKVRHVLGLDLTPAMLSR